MKYSAPPEELLAQAALLHRAGRLVEASAVYKQVLALKPDFPEVHLSLGNLSATLGARSRYSNTRCADPVAC